VGAARSANCTLFSESGAMVVFFRFPMVVDEELFGPRCLLMLNLYQTYGSISFYPKKLSPPGVSLSFQVKSFPQTHFC
jgi:hypothetical protein